MVDSLASLVLHYTCNQETFFMLKDFIELALAAVGAYVIFLFITALFI